MIKAIALDDEPLALEILEALCKDIADLALEACYTKTAAARKHLEEQSVDLLFLDVNMPTISGIDFYNGLNNPPLLILTTAYPEYAIEAFNLEAIDYLLKPFTKDRLLQAINKTKKILSQQTTSNLEPYLWLKSDTEFIKVLLKNILWIESLDNYIKIHLLDNKNLLTRMTMKNLQCLLPSNKFIRIHRSSIVAIDKIQQISLNTVTVNNIKLSIGALYKKDVQNLINKNA